MIDEKSCSVEQGFFHLLLYLALVQLGLIGSRVGVMLFERAGEVVITIESGASTEEDVVVSLEVQYRIYCLDARHADWRGRQTFINIGIVGRGVFQVALEYATQAEILQSILNRRVSLQGYALAQTIDIYARDARHLVRFAGLLIYNRRQSHNLGAAKSAALTLGIALLRPESLILLAHALHKLVGRYGPIELVCVGNIHREHCKG